MLTSDGRSECPLQRAPPRPVANPRYAARPSTNTLNGGAVVESRIGAAIATRASPLTLDR